jgi:hypothetical protein
MYILRYGVFTTPKTHAVVRAGGGGTDVSKEHTPASQPYATDWGNVFLRLLEYTYHSVRCNNSEDHNMTVLLIIHVQILYIWYKQEHNTCLSIFLLSRLQEKSAKRSAVRLESPRQRGGGGGGGRRAGEVEVRRQNSTNQEPSMHV